MINEKVLGRFANTGFHMFYNRGFDKRDVSSFVESFRPNQIECKKWLVEEIANVNMNWKKVLVLGSWNACLLYELMNEYCNVEYFDFLDINESCHKHRDAYFEANQMYKNYSSITMDATEFSDHSSYDLIINTSCEHMKDISAVYGPTYALQSNDYREIKDQHINCIDSERELMRRNNLTNLYFSGRKNLPNYNRFMVIGYYH